MSRIAAESADCRRHRDPRRGAATLATSEGGAVPARVIHEVKPRRNWFPILIPWAAAFALLAIAGYLGNQNQRLNELLNNDKGQIAQLSADAAHAQEVLDTLTSPDAKQVTLTEGKGAPPPPDAPAISPTRAHWSSSAIT